jgi:hypothetical protein
MRLFLFVLALTLSPLSLAAPKDMPARKPGLWEIKMQMSGMPQPMVSQQCIDEKTDDLMQQQGEAQARQQCSKNAMRKDGDKVIVETVCKFNGTTATTTATFSGDFSRNYRGEINTTYSPPMHGMKSSKQMLDAKWLGACKPGQKPGDVAMPGMGSMNLKDMMKNMPDGTQPRTPR